VIYQPRLISLKDLERFLQHTHDQSKENLLPEGRLVEIPVVYGGEFGPDLEFVAYHARLKIEEVIRIHSDREYVVHMIGFSPGFPLLGGLDERLYTPRLETPRNHIPQGSVGIGNHQTGVYSLESPGGWRIIGRTPLRLYQPEVDPPVLVDIGDIVRFRPISLEEYAGKQDSTVSSQSPRTQCS
jgi:inhibitor of KinA